MDCIINACRRRVDVAFHLVYVVVPPPARSSYNAVLAQSELYSLFLGARRLVARINPRLTSPESSFRRNTSDGITVYQLHLTPHPAIRRVCRIEMLLGLANAYFQNNLSILQ